MQENGRKDKDHKRVEEDGKSLRRRIEAPVDKKVEVKKK